MISNIHAVQPWLKQFDKAHRKIAESLLDSLVYITTSSMIRDLKEEILQNEGSDVVSILPIRELLPNEQVYDALNTSLSPLLQVSQEPLGSEAFISNLYIQLNRKNTNYFPLSANALGVPNSASLSLDMMRNLNVRKLILIDDIIGSGDRTKEFVDRLYNHPTIKSRLSFGTLKIEIIAYMATETGISVINKFIASKKGLTLNVLYKAPLISELANSDDIYDLCKGYANRSDKFPMGYKDGAVRVIFSHSAPNNIPTILYRSVNRYRPKNNGITGLTQWNALFPKRYIPTDFSHQIENKKINLTKSQKIKTILKLLDTNCLEVKKLSKMTNLPQYEIKRILADLKTNQWVAVNGKEYTITDIGKLEISSKIKGFKNIAISQEFYYPYKP